MNKYCNFNDIVHDVMTFCSNSASCGFGTMAQTLMANIFKITAAGNDFASVIKDSKKDQSLDDSFTGFELLGKDLGSILRAVIAFEVEKV